MFPVFVKPRIEKVGGQSPVLFYFDVQRVKRLSIKFFSQESQFDRSLSDRPVSCISSSPKEILVSLLARSCYNSSPA